MAKESDDETNVPKIYLETSLFGFYIDKDKGIAHRSTVNLFDDIVEGKYVAFTSDAVIKELNDTKDKERRNKLMDLVKEYKIDILPETEEATKLADEYISKGAISKNKKADALHIAIAAVSKLDTIVSMNFKHIVKKRTKRKTKSINLQKGYPAVEIYTPMEVEENDDKKI